MSGTGRVVLVGAGPGDPELLTLRGAAALREADVVVHDALASRELLALAPEHAECIDVGKRGHEVPTRSQEEITALLVELARQGKSVVRLKGGDPFVFGRGGEECSALAAAGIPYEVVPGISSVIGALSYAGIPITDRRHSASFAVVTGHNDPTEVSAGTRWSELATAADTLVVLMGMRNLETLVGRIVAGGRSPDTPAAAVIEGTLPSQRVVEAPLAELPRRVAEAGVSAPAVVVVGDVVKLRETLGWYEQRPLFGKRVLVTRAEDQAGEMVAALRAAGAEAIVAPMIRIAPPESWAEADAALARLGSYDVLLITSANAIRRLAARARELGVGFGDLGARVLCVGPKTADATLAEGLPVHALPGERYDAEGLLELIGREHAPAGKRFLFPRAERARAVLLEGLRAAGATVDAVSVYRTLPPAQDTAGLRERLVAGEIDALSFTSPSTVRNFLAQLDPEARSAAQRTVLAAIGPVTAEALRKEGMEPEVVPERAIAAELVSALARAMAGRPGGST